MRARRIASVGVPARASVLSEALCEVHLRALTVREPRVRSVARYTPERGGRRARTKPARVRSSRALAARGEAEKRRTQIRYCKKIIIIIKDKKISQKKARPSAITWARVSRLSALENQLKSTFVRQASRVALRNVKNSRGLDRRSGVAPSRGTRRLRAVRGERKIYPAKIGRSDCGSPRARAIFPFDQHRMLCNFKKI